MMEIEILKLDTTKPAFSTEFEKYENDFLTILSSSYPSYFGDDYQLKRIVEGRAILYFALADGKLVGVSYVKRNLRRGGTAVFPAEYRRLGIAERLVLQSLQDFPRQYSVLDCSNFAMLSLMYKLGFRKAESVEEIKSIVKEEFDQLSDFRTSDGCLVFKRKSAKRGEERDMLILVHNYRSW